MSVLTALVVAAAAAAAHVAAAAELTVSPQVLARSGDTVTVAWSGVPNPAAGDWLALYSADNATYFVWTYAFPAAETSAVAVPDSGAMNFTVYNMRIPVQFRYYAAASESHLDPPLLVSPVVTFAALLDEPTQVHVSVTANAGEMKVSLPRCLCKVVLCCSCVRVAPVCRVCAGSQSAAPCRTACQLQHNH